MASHSQPHSHALSSKPLLDQTLKLAFDSFRWWTIRMREVGYDPYRLAAECRISYRRLAKEFHRHNWGTLRTYVREQKAVQGRDWLKRLLSVKEAGAKAGYKHTSQFIVEFRGVYGRTPGEFLQAFRKANEWSWPPSYRRTDRAIAIARKRMKAKKPVP